MTVKFLADANLDQDIVLGLWRRQPLVEFELPQTWIPDSTSDPQVLRIAAQMDAILVTHDVRTMPAHFGAFVIHTQSPGMILVPTNVPIATAIDDLLLVWTVSQRGEWLNRYVRLPL